MHKVRLTPPWQPSVLPSCALNTPFNKSSCLLRRASSGLSASWAMGKAVHLHAAGQLDSHEAAKHLCTQHGRLRVAQA